MTLIVGILCDGGVVMAADSQGNLGSAGAGMTTAQQTAHKLLFPRDKMIVGFSGFVGLGQRLVPAIADACPPDLAAKTKPESLSTTIRNAMVKIVEPEYRMSGLVAQTTGNAAVLNYAVPMTLVALAIQDKPHLLQFTETCAPEFATVDMPFVAIGSGQRNAEPFLAFVRRTLWPATGLPSIADGLFSAYWTMHHVIATDATGSIGGPIQLASLSKDAKEWRAVAHTEGENALHEDAVEDVGRALLAWRAAFGKTPGTPSPTAPPE